MKKTDRGITSKRQSSVVEEERSAITSFRWGWYALALFVPFAGILTGLFLYDQDSKEVRKVGRNCLFIGFLVWVVFPLFIAMVIGIFLISAAANWVADMLPAAD
jgi:hypothetical protein